MSSLDSRLERGRKFLEEGEHFRILTHYDVDGVCSAGIVASKLLDMGKRFHISFLRNADRDFILREAEKGEPIILTDLGSSLVNELKGDVLILDHHKPPGDSDEVIHINPHLFGYDGSIEATATTMAYMLASDRKYARCFLAGILGDKQYLPRDGPVGLNRKLVELLDVRMEFDLPLFGEVGDAVFYSIEPFYPGLSGNREGVHRMLERIGINPTRNVDTLDPDEKTRLGSYLALNLVRNSKIPDAGKHIVDLDFQVEGSVRYLTELIDSACRTDNQSVAMAYILGEEESFDRMEVLRREYRSQVIEELYRMLENLIEREHVQFYYARSSYLASTVATIATMHLLDPKKVTLAMHMGEVTSVSARAHRSIMDHVDLGAVMRRVAEELGGHGGGHRMAAGATIPRGREEEFVEKVNAEIERSLSR